jgi:mannose-6-phosphate isomerase-like protein (cupin superfamily)
VVLSDGPPPQNHSMHGLGVGADFHEMWSDDETIPELTSVAAREPNERPFTIMPVAGHLLRILDVYPLKEGGKRTVMHRTQTLDYVVVIEGELVLILDDSEVILKQGDVVVQRGTDHAWENRSAAMARAAFFHIDARFSEELLAKLPKPLSLMR